MSEIKLTRRYPDSRPEDITDAYMRGVAAGMEMADSQTARRIDALERRIERLDGMLDGMGKGAASRIEVLQRMVEMHQAKLEETERRIAAMERKLNHKGGAA